ncbi:hypothetical protein DQ240_10345 [Blastococcus sp. TF02A-26]|nr:hypothetical protein DQ240_10345 [Blastococcus sp. TF02A-26]
MVADGQAVRPNTYVPARPEDGGAHYRRTMAGLLAAVALVVVLALVLVWVTWPERRLLGPASGARAALTRRDRARLAAAVATARWAPAHDEVDGRTRVLVRRACTGPDGLPVVLEERVFATFSADDPAWEAQFTEAMAGARFRCGYLNSEERDA